MKTNTTIQINQTNAKIYTFRFKDFFGLVKELRSNALSVEHLNLSRNYV